MKIEVCPICGSIPLIETFPMWRVCGDTIHGYRDSYNYKVHCTNEDCPMSLRPLKTDTVTYKTSKEAQDALMIKWNEQCRNIKKLMEENK